MAPPHSKRTVFSLNVDSDIEHVRQKIDKHNIDDDGKVRVLESKAPETRHADLSVVKKPFEELVNRTVDGVVEGSGKKVKSVDGEVAYHTEKKGAYTPGSRYRSGRSQRSLEAQYDTSEL